MTKLHESLPVRCPYVRAKDDLRETLAQAVRSGAPQVLELSAALPAIGIDLAKRVRVTYASAVDPMHFDEPFHVHWTPEAGGIYPSFEGQLTVRADESYKCSILELEGEYTPPLGVAGRLFDAAAGRAIASITAQRLLAKIAVEMVSRYDAEEAAKQRSGDSPETSNV